VGGVLELSVDLELRARILIIVLHLFTATFKVYMRRTQPYYMLVT
jgi:hypothetical protein